MYRIAQRSLDETDREELDGWWRRISDWHKYVVMDRDTRFNESFLATLKNSGAVPVFLPPRSPNLNAHIERFMPSIKDECLSRMIFFGETQLRNAIREYLAHYHGERNHQGWKTNSSHRTKTSEWCLAQSSAASASAVC